MAFTEGHLLWMKRGRRAVAGILHKKPGLVAIRLSCHSYRSVLKYIFFMYLWTCTSFVNTCFLSQQSHAFILSHSVVSPVPTLVIWVGDCRKSPFFNHEPKHTTPTALQPNTPPPPPPCLPLPLSTPSRVHWPTAAASQWLSPSGGF